MMLLSIPLFILMVGTAVPAWLGDRPAAFALAVEGVIWLIVDKWFEGPILIEFGHHHGLVVADFVGLGAIVGAGVCLLRARAPERAR